MVGSYLSFSSQLVFIFVVAIAGLSDRGRSESAIFVFSRILGASLFGLYLHCVFFAYRRRLSERLVIVDVQITR